MMFFRWLTSSTLRTACTLRKHVWNLTSAQRDILSPQAVGNLDAAIAEYDTLLKSGADHETLMAGMEKFEAAATKWIKPYPNAGWRENIEVVLVAVGVAMAVRTFFIQPFKIPTGSMQPTLFGVNSDNLLDQNVAIPTGWERVKEWFEGVSYIHVVAPEDGSLKAFGYYGGDGRAKTFSEPKKFLIFNLWQTYNFAGVEHKIWFPPDLGEQAMEFRADDDLHRPTLDANHTYHKGEDIVKLRVSAGDHLFVDRLTYNFRRPERGEIIVFATTGTKIEELNPREKDQFYIKRLCVLPGERVQIGDDRHLIINGHRLDNMTPHFENVYGFDPKQPPRESQFSGHVNGVVAQQFNFYPSDLAPLFPDQNTVFTNEGDNYMCFGDNTCNSSDSRVWGSFSAGNVIGKSCFVYWPLTRRFGWGTR